jgi:O-antigen ligase
MGAGIQAALIRSAQWGAIALGASIPFSVALDNVLLVIVAACWLAGGAWRETREMLRVNAVAVCSLLLFGLLALGALHVDLQSSEAARYLAKYSDLLFIPVFAVLLRDADQRRRALYAFSGSLLAVLLLSWWIAAGLPAGRPLLGTPDNPVVLKQYLTHGILMAFASYLFARFALDAVSGRSRALWAAASFAAAANVLMVQGRTGYIVLAALALYLAYAWLRWRGLAGAAAAIAALVAVLAAVPGPFQERFELEGAAAQSHAAQQARTSNAQRLEMYGVTLEIIRDHPVLGVGTGGFPAAYAKKNPGGAVTESRNPHNEYLLMAAQVGVAGLALLLALFWSQWRIAPRLATPFECELSRALVLTMVIGCLFNSLLLDHTEGLLYAWLTGVLCGGLKGAEMGNRKSEMEIRTA